MTSILAKSVDGLEGRFTRALRSRLKAPTQEGDRLVLQDAMEKVLTQAVCGWAGIPLDDADLPARARMLAELFEHAGSVGPLHWRARLARRRANRWIALMIRVERSDGATEPPDSLLTIVAAWRDFSGALLTPHVAAVELLNFLRPTAAISVYVTFAAHALHRNPAWLGRMQNDDDVACFVQEVRRFYPFFPAAVALLRKDVTWKGCKLPAGRRVLLDLYGTNRDQRIWNAPEEFRLERFRDWNIGPFELVPQGGGDDHLDHRCAGEWITIRLINAALKVLEREFDYELPPQDIALDMSRLPALPTDRFVIDHVSARQAGQQSD